MTHVRGCSIKVVVVCDPRMTAFDVLGQESSMLGIPRWIFCGVGRMLEQIKSWAKAGRRGGGGERKISLVLPVPWPVPSE